MRRTVAVAALFISAAAAGVLWLLLRALGLLDAALADLSEYELGLAVHDEDSRGTHSTGGNVTLPTH